MKGKKQQNKPVIVSYSLLMHICHRQQGEVSSERVFLRIEYYYLT